MSVAIAYIMVIRSIYCCENEGFAKNLIREKYPLVLVYKGLDKKIRRIGATNQIRRVMRPSHIVPRFRATEAVVSRDPRDRIEIQIL